MDGVAFAGREKGCAGFLHQFCIAIVCENDHLMAAFCKCLRNANERIDIAQTAKTGDDEFYGSLLGGIIGSRGGPMFRETTLTGYNISGNSKRQRCGADRDSRELIFTTNKSLRILDKHPQHKRISPDKATVVDRKHKRLLRGSQEVGKFGFLGCRPSECQDRLD